MRIISTQKRLGEGSFQSVTVVQRLKSRSDDFVAKSDHLVQFGKRRAIRSSYGLSMRGRYKVFGNKLDGLAEALNLRSLDTALDAVLGLKPLQVEGGLRTVN